MLATPVIYSHPFLSVSRAPGFRAPEGWEGEASGISAREDRQGYNQVRGLETGEHCLGSSAGIHLDYGV